jgi:hypothetical protein
MFDQNKSDEFTVVKLRNQLLLKGDL